MKIIVSPVLIQLVLLVFKYIFTPSRFPSDSTAWKSRERFGSRDFQAKCLHEFRGDCRQVLMDSKRIPLAILITLGVTASAPAQERTAEAAKGEALTLKAQIVELEGLKTEIKAQEEKIDRLTQEVAKLNDAMKQKGAPPVAKPAEPIATPTPSIAAGASANPATAGVENPSPADSANVKTHVVAKGETLSQISKQYGVTVEEIEQLNKIEDAKKLQAGQTIKIPSATPQPSPGG
jgi:LysM repeat protein